jgi:hypothetical protein
MKTIFGFFSAALAGAIAQTIAAAANSGQTLVLNVRFTISYPFLPEKARYQAHRAEGAPNLFRQRLI